ncbi:MAG: UTP--glucose-1-phosphate uridylyltransferase, partial [Planctomycetota bacterium JB042]
SKVRAAAERYGARLPMLVMTSEANHDETVGFLERHGRFGLPEEDVFVFRQGMLPAVDAEGRLLLRAEGELFLSPDGHGGSLGALAREGLLDELERRGVEEIFYFQVDNPLVKVLDPAFLGHHRLGRAEASSKAVPKRDASEKVGVFAKAGRKLGIVEYSDLPDDLGRARDDEGELAYRAGNVAIHVFRTEFVRRLTEGGLRLPYPRARKAVSCLDPAGDSAAPAEVTGVKFETFVFDALPEAKRSLVVEASRAEEFSPVKNASGDDSAATARRDMTLQFRSWLEAAGFELERGDDVWIEISPHLALDRDELIRRLKKERVLSAGRLLIEPRE